MMETLKRYFAAMLFLLLVIFLTLGFTFVVTKFGDQILIDANITVMPTSQKVNL